MRKEKNLRASAARALLKRLEEKTPPALRSLGIQALLYTTAAAFGTKGRKVRHLSPEKALQAYSEYTVSCMRESRHDRILEKRLYREARLLGRRIRSVTGFTRAEDLERLVFFLYHIIGITMEGHLPGTVIVSSCYFSRVYSPAQCALMSHMDAGLIAGICGDAELVFTERITEGCGRCCARFAGHPLRETDEIERKEG